MATALHFRFPGGFGAPELLRFAGFLFKRGVSQLWLDSARGSSAEAGAVAGLTVGVATSPYLGDAIEAPREVLLEAPCVDWHAGSELGKIEELGRMRNSLLAKGAREVFLRLVHHDPVLAFNLGRLAKKRLGAPLLVSVDGRDDVADALSAGPLLEEGLADAVLVIHDHCEDVGAMPELESSAGRLIERAKRILSMLGLYPKGYELVSCPTCGRCGLDVEGMARETDSRMRALEEELRREGKELERIGGITVAVMGCNVNGPGEAKAADIGIAGGKNRRGTLFMKGKPVRTLPEGKLVQALMNGVRAILDERFGAAGGAERGSGI
jgi:hypothetical protein